MLRFDAVPESVNWRIFGPLGTTHQSPAQSAGLFETDDFRPVGTAHARKAVHLDSAFIPSPGGLVHEASRQDAVSYGTSAPGLHPGLG